MSRWMVAVAALVLTAAVADTTRATPPGTNGRIVFERLRFQNSPLWGELFVMNPDGSGVRQLTHPPDGTEDSNPDWSPDGTRIVFERRPPSGAYSIWTIGSNGGGLRRISPPCPAGDDIPKCAADDGWPVWSPDGRHLAFQRLIGPLRPKGASINSATAIFKDELVVTDPDGRHARTLVWLGPWRGDPQAPAWSPDGKRLVFLGKYMNSKTNGTGCECRALYIVNADGTGLRRLTPPSTRPGGHRPDWSPDGKTILFRTHPGNDPSGIGANLYTIHPDGTTLRQLTHMPPADRVESGTYSPDGKLIVFETSHGAAGPGNNPDVFVMTANGTHVHALTHTENFETSATWGPAPR
jgi:TolB protein